MTNDMFEYINKFFETNDTSKAFEFMKTVQEQFGVSVQEAYTAISKVLSDKWLDRDEDPIVFEEVDETEAVHYEVLLVGYTGPYATHFYFTLCHAGDIDSARSAYDAVCEYGFSAALRSNDELKVLFDKEIDNMDTITMVLCEIWTDDEGEEDVDMIDQIDIWHK